ncbi:MAG: trypsin-like peptidase domain-containing protein [Cyanobacteria bacterium J06598_3]
MPPQKNLARLTALSLLMTLTGLAATGLNAISHEQPAPQQPLAATEPTSAAIAFNPATDHPTHIPTDREQTAVPYDDGRFVIGRDERKPVTSRSFPWSAVGRLELQDANGQTISTCTGTLVDADLVLTNAHCLQQQAAGSFISSERYRQQQSQASAPKFVFKPSLINGIALDEATVISYRAGWSEDTATNSTAADWAILKLDAPLGNIYGSLGFLDLNISDPNVTNRLAENTTLIGYSGDFPTPALSEFGQPAETAGIDEACSIVGIFPDGDTFAGTVMHDCDATPGSSGGPILFTANDGIVYIIGLNAYQTPLAEAYTLPDGTVTRGLNAGVQVSHWAPTFFEMLTP